MARPLNAKNVLTEIKSSPGKGRGVFALLAISKGTMVEIAPTLTIPREDVNFIRMTMLTDYAFEDETNDDVLVLGLGHSSMYNHSFEPNAEWTLGKGVILIRATENIAAGEDLYEAPHWHEDGKCEAATNMLLATLEAVKKMGFHVSVYDGNGVMTFSLSSRPFAAAGRESIRAFHFSNKKD